METLEAKTAAAAKAPTGNEARQPALGVLPLAVQHQRMLTLVADLLLENQQLSCKVARLEMELKKSERGLAAATRWTGMAF